MKSRSVKLNPPQNDLLAGIESDWARLPNPKIRRPPPGAPFEWAYSYTAFSLPFADAALRALGAGPQSAVLDPFVGSGTTLVAAAGLGAAAMGLDLSPFAVLLTRARLAVDFDERQVESVLTPPTSVSVSDNEPNSLFSQADATYIQCVIARMRRLAANRKILLEGALSGSVNHSFDSLVIALLGLCLAARTSAKVTRGSNPIWLRRGQAERLGTPPLQLAAYEWAKRIAHDLASVGSAVSIAKYSVQIRDLTDWNTAERFEFCLTSPPYPNRLDYVVAHLPELTVLGQVFRFQLDHIRRSMIGTTRVANKSIVSIPTEWGSVCLDALVKIRKHPSYASERYYFHTYADYFDKMYRALGAVSCHLKRKSKGAMVVQNSFYKDVEILTPEIFCQMLQTYGFEAAVVRSAPVNVHMATLRAKSRLSVGRSLNESVIMFERRG